MRIKRLTEKELLKDLDAKSAHANELAEPLPQELTPLECQRQFKTDPLIGNIANLKLTHPGRLSIG